jgi:eukaryotic-like serine/threonine-protein kinase
MGPPVVWGPQTVCRDPRPGQCPGGTGFSHGKWIAYASDESGKQEIYVENFPPAGGKWQVSTDGGIEPSWSPNGKELFYLHLTRLMAVDVRTETDRFDQRTPHVLFDAPFGNIRRNAYVVSPDGRRFLVNARIESAEILPMTVILNWPAAVRRQGHSE